MSLIRLIRQPQPEVDLKKTYDAIVVGSGAAGGMAAHVFDFAWNESADAGSRQETRHR